MRVTPLSMAVMLLSLTAVPSAAQSYEDNILRGDSLAAALKPAEALEAYRAAYLERQTYDAMRKFARAEIDVAKQLHGKSNGKLRDSLYGVARLYADAAVRTDSLDAEGYFLLANALGRLSRTRGGKERVRFAKQIYEAGAKALSLDPNHDGAHHVVGAWHAEVKRLSGMARFFAKTFLGGGFLGMASWDSAVVHLERAVELKPEYLYHRLELAEVYIDLDRYADARRELTEILQRPPTSDVSDPENQDRARTLLEEIRDKS